MPKTKKRKLTGRIAIHTEPVSGHATADRLHRGHLAGRQLFHVCRFVGLQRFKNLLLDNVHPFVAFVGAGRLKVPLFVVQRNDVEFKGIAIWNETENRSNTRFK